MRLRRTLLALALAATACRDGGRDGFALAIDLPTTASWTISGTTIEAIEGGHDLAWVEDRIRGEGRDVIGGEAIDGGWRVRAVERASSVTIYDYRTLDGVGVLCRGRDEPSRARCAAIRSPYAQELTIPIARGERIESGGLVLVIGDGCTVERDLGGVGATLCRGLHAR